MDDEITKVENHSPITTSKISYSLHQVPLLFISLFYNTHHNLFPLCHIHVHLQYLT